jgi:hypothetical protein
LAATAQGPEKPESPPMAKARAAWGEVAEVSLDAAV